MQYSERESRWDGAFLSPWSKYPSRVQAKNPWKKDLQFFSEAENKVAPQSEKYMGIMGNYDPKRPLGIRYWIAP